MTRRKNYISKQLPEDMEDFIVEVYKLVFVENIGKLPVAEVRAALATVFFQI